MPDCQTASLSEQPAATPATFVIGDVFALDHVAGTFDAAFVGFWWSHVLRQDLSRFLIGLHRRLAPGSVVVVLDNRYVEGSNTPITRTDGTGNTYQMRRLERGTEHEVLKNFPSHAEIHAAIRGVREVGHDIPIIATICRRLTNDAAAVGLHCWCVALRVAALLSPAWPA